MKITRKLHGEVIAQIRLDRLKTGPLEVGYIRVEPAHRGRGLGTALLEKAKKHADKTGRMLVAIFYPEQTGLTKPQLKAWFARHGFSHDWIILSYHHRAVRGMAYTPKL